MGEVGAVIVRGVEAFRLECLCRGTGIQCVYKL